ncbi:hypothetical protein F5Y12DRAFT_669412 [Xylaria sp. FL1777]|nr:hypothetical protein F5Y12DRAFT_669412 [Xylaria sp. FL1777]
MSGKSGWYEDEDRTYYADRHGRPIVVKGKGYHYHCPDIGISTYPEVLSGAFKPSNGAPSSYPPRSQPHVLSSRFTDRHIPYFGPGSEHSDRANVDHPASRNSVHGYSRPGISTDVYRDAKSQFAAAGPSISSYDKEYYGYKRKEIAAAEAGRAYRSWRQATHRYPTLEEKQASPANWGGSPMQTQEWHREASRRADEVVRAAQAHTDARQDYTDKYIGYHEQRYYPGHTTAIESARQYEGRWRAQERHHNNWDSLQDKIDRGRARREDRAGRRD